MRLILDSSKWEDDPNTPETINWQKVKDAGVSAVIMKATGTYKYNNYIDGIYQLHSKNSCGIMPRGSYHFFETNGKPEEQARFYWDQIKNNAEEIAPTLDIEGYPYGSLAKGDILLNQIKIFLDVIESLSQKVPLVYCNQDMIRNFMQIYGKTNHWLTRYPLWFSWPQTTAPTLKDINPWNSCILWQFNYRGNALKYGFTETKEVDENYFMLSEEDYSNFISNSSPVDPITPIEPEVGLTYITNSNMNIRSGAGVNFPVVGTLSANTTITPMDVAGDECWIKLADNAWVCRSRKGYDYLKLGE